MVSYSLVKCDNAFGIYVINTDDIIMVHKQ